MARPCPGPRWAVTPLLVAMSLGAATGLPAIAADDVADPEPVAAQRQPKAKPRPKAEPQPKAESRDPTEGDDTEGPFAVTLVNGDRITGTIVGLEAGSLRLKPDVTPEAAVELPCARIDGVSRTGDAAALQPRGDRLYPVAGGVIHGPLSAIDAQGITVDVHLVGPITLPFAAVSAFVRQGNDQPERSAAARFAEVHDVSGSRFVGGIDVGPSALTVTAEGVTATVAVRQVSAILFPVTAERRRDGDGPDDHARPLRCTLELLNGSEIVGVDPRLDETGIVVGIAPDRTMAVPLDRIARLSFGSGAGPAAARRRVVFWSQFADPEEEVAHMVEALREGLPPGWSIEMDGGGPQAADLAAALQPAGVLVVPEMESFDGAADVEAAAVGRDIKAFLGRGGTVVIAGVDDDTMPFWEEAGLLSLSAAERTAGGEFTFVRGHPLARDVGDSFKGVNATYEFETQDGDLVPVARGADGAAAVLVKKVGRGSLVLLGMDYFERSEAIDRILVNAVTLGRGR